MFDSPPRR